MLEPLTEYQQASPAAPEDIVLARLATALPPSAVARGDRFALELQAFAGRQNLLLARVELLPLMSSLVYMLQQTLDSRIEVTMDFDRRLAPCNVDAKALERALSGLIANACDAMPHGGRLNLSVQAGQLPDGRPAFAVSVMDSGTGMTRDLMQCAVRPFFTTKSHDPLAGLGLSAVDGFARQMGGSLSLRSSAGSGLTATILLP